MPPKKLTKAEKDRLRQEAERRAQEEEEQRLKEEEERRKIEEEERKKREEEEQKLRAEEKARFDEETAYFVQIRERQNELIQAWKRKEKEKREWEHYISCNQLPLVSDEQALNMYFSIYKDSPTASTIDESLARVSDLLKLLRDMDSSLHTEEEEPNKMNCHIKKIHGLIKEELDEATLLSMENSDRYIDSETFNLILERQTPSLTYCLWGNIVKNPRLKDFSFQSRGFTLELPKPMLLADVAIRVMYPSYDNLSPRCKTYHCPIPAAATVSQEEGEEDLGITEDTNTQQDEPALVEKEESPPVIASKSGSRISSSKSVASSVKDKPAEDGDQGEGTTVIGDGEQPEETTATNDEEEEMAEDEVNMRSCTVVGGGPILLDLLVLPPQPKSINNWMIRQFKMDSIVLAPDLVDPSGAPVPVPITMNLPQPYLFPDEEGLQLAQWDEETESWRLGGLKDVKFDQANKSVSFVMTKFSPLAILMDTYINLPYQSWELLPLGIDHTLLHIVGAAAEITVQIKCSECMLTGPLEDPVAETLINKPFPSPAELIKALINVGFYFFPASDAGKYASLTAKNEQLESDLYQYMSMACGGWGFQWSQWNEKSGFEGVVLQAATCSEDKWTALQDDPNPDNLSHWSSYLCTTEKTVKLKLTETDEDYTDTPADEHVTHSELYSALLRDSTGTDVTVVSDMMSQTNPVHIHAVKHWLTATRPLVATC